MFFNELPNNTSQQLPLLLVDFGFTPAQSALFNIAKPLWGSFLILVSAAMLYTTNLGVGFTCAISYIPCFVGGLIMVRPNLFSKVCFSYTYKDSAPPPGPTRSLWLSVPRSQPSSLRTSWVCPGPAPLLPATPRSSLPCPLVSLLPLLPTWFLQRKYPL